MTGTENEQWAYDAEFDAKEAGCGDLVIALFRFFKTVSPGTRVRVTATDMGASLEIATWCRSTDKQLIKSEPPYFLIKK